MTEQDEDDKYIKCSNCRCKYNIDEEHIKADFGFNRLSVKYKTCLKRRGLSRQAREQIQGEVNENEP